MRSEKKKKRGWNVGKVRNEVNEGGGGEESRKSCQSFFMAREWIDEDVQVHGQNRSFCLDKQRCVKKKRENGSWSPIISRYVSHARVGLGRALARSELDVQASATAIRLRPHGGIGLHVTAAMGPRKLESGTRDNKMEEIESFARTLTMLISNLTESVFRPTLSNTSGSATSPVEGGDTFYGWGVAAAKSRGIGAESCSERANSSGGRASRHPVGPWAR